ARARALAAPCPCLPPPARPLLRCGRPSRLHRRGRCPGRGAGLRYPARAVSRYRHLAAAGDLPGAPAPHIAGLGRVPAPPGQYGDLERHPDNQQLPGIVILRVESGLFFANADAVRQSVRAHAATKGTRVVVLDAETAPAIDVTAVH